MKTEAQLNIGDIKKRFEQLQKIQCKRDIKMTEVAKELGVKVTRLLDFIETNEQLFSLVSGHISKTSKALFISAVYEGVEFNPETKEYLARMKTLKEKTIRISYYDNYGHIHGYYIQPSSDEQAKYLNTLEKIKTLAEKLKLKPALYYLGGFGDSSTIKPENGYEISASQLDLLRKEGWTIIGEYRELKDSGSFKPEVGKINTPESL